MKAFVLVLAVLLWFTPHTSQAACLNPTGTEGSMIYNGVHKVAQFCNGTDWIGMAGGSTSIATGDTMVPGWPDALACVRDSDSTILLYSIIQMANSLGSTVYRLPTNGAQHYDITFNDDGTFKSNVGGGANDCDNKTISQLYSDGQAFNFVGGQGVGANDNLGNHTATQNLDLGSNTLVGEGGSAGLYVDVAGNIAIGVTGSGAKLSVAGEYSGQPASVDIIGNVAQSYGQLEIRNRVENTNLPYLSLHRLNGIGWQLGMLNNTLVFANGGGAGRTDLFTNRPLSITPSGNVGIGTTNPRDQMEIGTGGMTFHTGGFLYHGFNTYFDGVASRFGGYRGGARHAARIDFDPDSGGIHILSTGVAGAEGQVATLDRQMTILSNGNVGIGANNPQRALHIYDQEPRLRLQDNVNGAASAAFVEFVQNDGATIGYVGNASATNSHTYIYSAFGNILANGVGGSCYVNTGGCASDLRLKQAIKPVDNSLDKLMRISGVSFEWKAHPGKKYMGFIAQNVEEEFPILVETDEAGMKSVNYNGIAAPIVEAVKELKRLLDRLWELVTQHADEIAALEAENETMRSEIAALQAANDTAREAIKAANDNFRRELDELKAAISD